MGLGQVQPGLGISDRLSPLLDRSEARSLAGRSAHAGSPKGEGGHGPLRRDTGGSCSCRRTAPDELALWGEGMGWDGWERQKPCGGAGTHVVVRAVVAGLAAVGAAVVGERLVLLDGHCWRSGGMSCG